MNLVIVESPTKAKTIGKFLGPNFEILACFGHVRDLPKDKLGIDVQKNFEPLYVAVPRAKKVLKVIKEKAKSAQDLYLATDYDREGEAIAWHILQAAGLQNQKSEIRNPKYRRITFHEITKEAIQNALK